ncbi:MAG: hypothetical protein WD737_06945 [Gemmatimonadota bacterium]
MGAISIDLTAITAIWMGGVLLLVPLTGLTVRWGFTPFVHALAEYRGASRGQRSEGELRNSVAAVEARLNDLESAVEAHRREAEATVRCA